MLELAASTLVLALLLPHLLPLQRVTPVTAGAVWLAALLLRSVLASCAAILMLAWLPQTAGFAWLAGLTWHRLAGATPHIDLSGDPLAHAAAILPAALLALSIVAFLGAMALTARRLGERVRQRTVGEGPGGSVVVADQRVFVAVTGLGHPRLLVSNSALAVMDDQELAASLAHEHGHVDRLHRPLAFIAALLAQVARLLPGTRASERGLRLSLERDADEYAVEAIDDPLALASAICKVAAGGRTQPLSGALALGGGTSTAVRVEQLLGDTPRRTGALVEYGALALVGLLSTLVAACVGVLAAWLSPDVWALGLAVACSS